MTGRSEVLPMMMLIVAIFRKNIYMLWYQKFKDAKVTFFPERLGVSDRFSGKIFLSVYESVFLCDCPLWLRLHSCQLLKMFCQML